MLSVPPEKENIPHLLYFFPYVIQRPAVSRAAGGSGPPFKITLLGFQM
jgi:hypothetical protein